MKKTLIGLAVTVLGLSLVSCTTGDDPKPSPSASSSPKANPLEKVKWIDAVPPTLEFEAPLKLTGESVWRLVAEGDGAGAKADPGRRVVLEYVLYNGDNGSVLESSYDTGTPWKYTVPSEAPQGGDYLYDAVHGQTVGSRLLLAWAPQGLEESAEQSEAAAGVFLMAVTVAAATPLRAEGEAVEPKTTGLPTVTLDDSGKPSIKTASGKPPTKLVSEVLIKGDGVELEATDQVYAQYTGWLWDGTQFDSSWDRGAPATFPLESLVPGWAQGLTGQTVGSQVLLVIPPELGYGEQGQPPAVPGGATLIFVVDILDADKAMLPGGGE
ncbi:MAG: FKBP-type peptidyl-prolyl cis-trans isomerase [Bifidobacteriaceae bacterium]|jgi:peptidylprolyl isomerase|nr:FKBP-type peptidyl-prolyl cis-trans isomerase [Bifidobacteriaceae bacterium]